MKETSSLKLQLIVTCLDYSKAFDYIKQEKLIETLIPYKVHYKIIDVVANIYKDEYNRNTIWRHKKKIELTTSIRQGCTTILFKIITYMIMAELDRRGKKIQ